MKLTNRKITDIHLLEDTYSISIAIKKTYLERWDNYYFALNQRYIGVELPLDYSKKKREGEYFLFQVDFPYHSFASYFNEGEALDLYIVREQGDERTRSRIKSNDDHLEFLQLRVDNGQIFHPFTTRKGNVSFSRKDPFLFGRLENVDLTKDGMLHLNGLYHYPDLEKVINLQLVITSNLHDDVMVFDIVQEDIPKTYKNYDWYKAMKHQAFSAKFDLKTYLTLGKTQYFKFYLQMEVNQDNRTEMVQSSRLKVNTLKQEYPVTLKRKFAGKKFKIYCKPTRKSKYLSLSVAPFKPIPSMLRRLKRKWVEIRRSDELLKLYKVAFYLLGKVLPVQKNLVVFESFHGKQYSDNPRAIYEYMKEHRKKYQLVWSADRRHIAIFQEKNVTYVRRFSIRWLWYMTRARYWVTNARLPLWIPKPKHTKYLQSWHGTPLKRLAADMEEVHMPGTNTKKYKKNFIKEASKWDYLISPNAYSTEIFRRAFQFDKEMIESGYPRNDYLTKSNHPRAIENLKEKLKLPKDKKVILYAPTWRDNQFYQKGKYKFNLELDLDRLYEAFGDTHVMVLRMHYLVAENLDISAYKGFVYDFSNYEDIRDLYLIADVLITDYSSVFFDYANLKRPMIFFVYDIDDYRDHLRGFYFDFERKAPGPLVQTTEEIIEEIQKIEENGFMPSEVEEAFYQRFCYLEDGNASERVVKKVFNK
ncbi:CDP-glycerol glycerophosphotransferase family protein [Oceanobacillus senegalensis]|uniref:CDP-glycerol glycerophosphotransferase family protein n=1 Tax=Oceanobacillus senegalensis TaxID=1936063 RepID=UPI000A30C609|nr:CDP-glycerol glycerophosphotransferase family protein [Oceanobacillus senegalensis]